MRPERPEREPDIAFTVHGQARPAGSKNSGVAYRNGPDGKPVPVTRANGSIVTFTKDSSGAKGEEWRKNVAAAAAAAKERLGLDLLTGPLFVEFDFYKVRPKSHYGSGRNAHVLKPSAPAYPDTRPDVLKLTRAIEDACSKVIYEDDSRIVGQTNTKLYVDRGEGERCEVRIWDLTDEGMADADEQTALALASA